MLAAASARAADPGIDNRTPKADEIGYRPEDGTATVFNPPSLTWLHESKASAYDVEWSRQADFGLAETATNLPFNTYTHGKTLEPGDYFWRYRFTDGEGQRSHWSQVRKFTVNAAAIPFPMPNRSEQRQRVPQEHPRLFVRPEELPRLRGLAMSRGDSTNELAAERFRGILAEANRLLKLEPVPEPTVRGSARDPKTRDYWWPNRTQTEKACMEAETLAFAFLLTGEERYAEPARKRIVNLAGWDPDGPTNFKLNCEAAKPMLFRLPRAYDWAYAALTETEREQVRNVMRRRALDAWNSGEVGQGVGHLNRPFNSHGNRTFHKLGECAIAFLGEIPEAETWLDYAVNKFYAAYPVWADDDGGWHEGTSYWAGYLSKIPWWLEATRSALQIDGFNKPFFAQVGDFPLYTAPPGSPNMGFGDLSYRPPSPSYGRFAEYFLRASAARGESSHAGYWRWWSEQWSMDEADGIMGFLWAANLPVLPASKAPIDLPQSKVFRGIGVASLHLTLTNSAEDVHLLFKSSPYGSQSHGHNPQNSYQLNAYGEALLTTCVYRDWHGSPFHYQWAHSTRAHNSLLVDGQGQVPHTAMLKGRILDFEHGKDLDYVIGSAPEAYGGRLERFRRSIAFAKPDLIVIFDDLAATNEVTFQFMSHGLKPFLVNTQECKLTLQARKAGVEISYLAPFPLEFRQFDGFEPKPEKDFPNQWHVEASTKPKSKELLMLTVLAPFQTPAKPQWRFERIETPSAIGIRGELNDEVLYVGFRKPNQAGTARLASFSFDKPVALFRVNR